MRGARAQRARGRSRSSGDSRERRWTCSRSRSSPPALRKSGARTIFSNLIRRAYPYRDLPRADFDAIVEMLSEGIAARRGRYGAYLFRDRVNHRVKGRRGAASRPSPAAARFPKMRSTPSWPRPTTRRSAPWTKISPSRAWPATSCCSATLPGAFAACKPAASSWKTRKARRPTFPSGAAKRRRAPPSFPRSFRGCATKIADRMASRRR